MTRRAGQLISRAVAAGLVAGLPGGFAWAQSERAPELTVPSRDG
jgi:hypothetical protein